MRSSYSDEDVILLLKDITGMVQPQPTEEREKLIQAGKHYSEMLPVEYVPTEKYMQVYREALKNYAKPVALAVGRLADKIIEKKGQDIVLVSLARAGIPIGILVKRYIAKKYQVNVPHYSISIIRGRGIDDNAMKYLLSRYEPGQLLFVDGWIGKGAILNELKKDLAQYEGVSSDIAVIADPANVTELCGTHDDILIPSSCLNSTVSGLISRTFLRSDIIGKDDFHGAVYYGELKDVKEDTTLDLTSDKAASYRESGMYDAVSSATTNKYKSFFSSTYSEDNTNGQGGSIIGMKDVNIAVPTSLYENAKKAISDKKECSNKLLEIISSMKLSDTTPSEYKILNGDGTLTAMKSDVTEDTSDTLTIKTQSSYGQYEVDPVTSENSPLSKLSAKDSLLGIIVEDKDGNKYGMEHLENIWVGGKFAFAVTDGFKEKHGNTIDYKRHESLQGKTIKKVTYLVKDDADIVINTDLKCKTLAGSDSIKATANDNFKDGATVSVDTTAVPSGSNYTLSSVSMGKTVLTEGADYTYANNTLTIKATDNTGVGSYSMVFTDNTYSDIVASFTLESGYKTGDISINKNNQITLPAGVSFEKYVNNITSIKINGVEKTGKGGIKATDLFDADGNINFNAAIKGKDGSSTPVFADKSASYTIELTSTGYPSVSGTVQLNTSILEASIKKAEALDSSKYTAETWKSLQTALTEAKEAKSANTQTIVDAANTKLTEALSGLKEKTVTPSKPATEKKNNTTPALKKANVKLSKPVLKVGKTTKNKAKVTWKKVKKATGYEIQYTTKGFGNQKATKTIKVSKAKITSAQLKKLKKKTRYKVRIRAVYTEAGYQTATSKWSAIKTVKTK